MNELQVTSLDELKEVAKGTIVTLPGWNEKPFVCRVKRVSLLGLVSKGAIPNALLGAADKVFNKPNADVDIKELGKLFDIFAEETLIEPKLKDIKELSLELTDEQKLVLFNFTQQGLKALEQFRTEQTGVKDNKIS
ncbi:hypothetical protein CPJCM30710_24920 [Clostridium polyendosporum]|uniref:Uncharacterized protein n=1 Tax=Clostridium polyendosporum TaxID=69208 RepID=A0A919S0Q9_9CLOT|nr:esterase [Clostridium polyendosporum]GIM29826.1 hypothetical protein CPJCM30710_24920 [Clostridium polyendosporum]